jgi:hypothetical protein
MIFFPVHSWLFFRGGAPLRTLPLRRTAGIYLIGCTIPLAMMGYYYFYFDTFNLVAAVGGASFSQITVNRMRAVLFSPEVGIFWYFPAAWLAVVLAWKKPDRMMILLIGASVAAVATLCSATTNINSAQLASPRYALWFLAPLYFLPFAGTPAAASSLDFGRTRRALVALLAVAGIVLWLRTHQFITGEWRKFYSLHRATPRVASLYRLTRFDDDIEPLVENIQGEELVIPISFRGIYIWNLGHTQSLWIISTRAWLTMGLLTISGEIADIEQSVPLQNVFIFQRDATGALRAYPKKDVTFQKHPYWGGYLLLWANGSVNSAVSPASVKVQIKQYSDR